MHISRKALDELIKPVEGYHSKQPDGSCRAYLCPAGVWTCGWGCTEGVNQHTHWTRDEAEERLAAEMIKHEEAVQRLVKVPLNQGQFDALVSLSYNIGEGAVGRSTLLKHLNVGDYARAASHFADFKYSVVTGSTAQRMKVAPGTKVVLPGLVTRRALEAQFFLHADPVAEAMPQKVEEPRTKLDLKQIATRVGVPAVGTGSVVGGVGTATKVPEGVNQTVQNVAAWRGVGKAVGDAGREVVQVFAMTGKLWPYAVGATVGIAGLGFIWWRRGGSNEQAS